MTGPTAGDQGSDATDGGGVDDAADEVARSLQQAMRTLRNEVDRLGDLDAAQRAQAAEQLVEDAARLDDAIAAAAETDGRSRSGSADGRD